MRVLLAPLVAVAVLVALPASAPARSADETHILSPFSSFTTKEEFQKGHPLTVTISGSFTITPKPGSFGIKPCQVDAFYTYGECLPKPVDPGTLFVGAESDNFNPSQIRHFYDPDLGKSPPYSPTHRYTFKLDCQVSSDCGRLRFYGAYGTPPTDRTYKGAITVEIGDSSPSSVVVDFSFVVTGKPNVAIKGADANLVSSRLSGSGHVTFTKRQGALLVGTESKGSIVHDDTRKGGKHAHVVFGIITGGRGKALGSTYSPSTRRLLLLLKTKESDDPGCEESGLLTPTIATLTLIPGAGVRDQAVLVGSAATSATNACKGHAHAWANGSGGVTVRISLRQGPG